MKLWKTYLFKELFKTFLFFLLCSFLLYSLIEYATRINSFLKNSPFGTKDIALYYINQFLKRAEFVVPLSLLLSVIHVLTSLNSRNEWTVLQLAGLSSRALLKPFFILALLCSSFLWINFEYFLPSALKQIDAIQLYTPRTSSLTAEHKSLHTVPLPGGSKLIYQSYLPQKQQFFDVLWIKGSDEMWKIKYLNEDPLNPVAYYADHLVRNREGVLEKKESYPLIILHGLKWHPAMMHNDLLDLDYQSVSKLYHLIQDVTVTSYEKIKIKTLFSFKLMIPLLSPLAVALVAPYCLIFSRHRSLFSLYSLALFTLFAFYMLLDALAIMSDHALLPPFIALFLPFMLLTLLATYRLKRDVV
ncbi:MAG: LptF/LptG family permease [Candidatus Rhabdochlamydia sp.]